jgi:hypothetical protein
VRVVRGLGAGQQRIDADHRTRWNAPRGHGRRLACRDLGRRGLPCRSLARPRPPCRAAPLPPLAPALSLRRRSLPGAVSARGRALGRGGRRRCCGRCGRRRRVAARRSRLDRHGRRRSGRRCAGSRVGSHRRRRLAPGGRIGVRTLCRTGRCGRQERDHGQGHDHQPGRGASPRAQERPRDICPGGRRSQ